jgi:hypothetical protein
MKSLEQARSSATANGRPLESAGNLRPRRKPRDYTALESFEQARSSQTASLPWERSAANTSPRRKHKRDRLGTKRGERGQSQRFKETMG